LSRAHNLPIFFSKLKTISEAPFGPCAMQNNKILPYGLGQWSGLINKHKKNILFEMFLCVESFTITKIK
jgi:hypothetical protein